MKSHPFTRPTIVAAVEFLGEMRTQAKFDQLAVRLGLDDEILQGPAKSALLPRIVNQRATQIVSTLDGPVTLAEAGVREAIGVTVPRYAKAEQERFLRGLALDGYVFSWDGDARTPLLRAALPGEVDLPAADDEVHQLLKQFGFNVPLGHLDQTIDAHIRGEWAATNSQTRTFGRLAQRHCLAH